MKRIRRGEIRWADLSPVLGSEQGGRRPVVIVSHDLEFVAECAPRIILMSKGEIISDGTASEVLTDPEKVLAASLVCPQITQLFQNLSDLALPGNVIDLYEAQKLLVKLIKGNRT